MASRLVEYKIELGSVKSSRDVVKALRLKSKSVDFSKQQTNDIRNYNNALKRLNDLNKQVRQSKHESGNLKQLKQLQYKKQKAKDLLSRKLDSTLGITRDKDGNVKYRYDDDGRPDRGLLPYSLKHGTTTIEKAFHVKKIELSYGVYNGIYNGGGGLQASKPFEEMSKSEVANILQRYNAEQYMDSFNGRSDDGWVRRTQIALGAEHLGIQEFLDLLNKIMV